MAKNNSANQDFTSNADGWDLSGGTTKRKITLSGGDVAMVGAGSASITFPASSGTLATLARTETLTNKTIDRASNTLTGVYFAMEFAHTTTNPVNGTTYYFGFPFDSSAQTSAALRQKIIPFARTLRGAAITITAAAGTAETSTMYARINNTTDVVLSSAITVNASHQTFSVTGLSQAIAAGDEIECKWIAPTWATPPTSVRTNVTLFFE